MKIQEIECADREKAVAISGTEIGGIEEIWLLESEQRDLLRFLKKTRPQAIRDIFCEGCASLLCECQGCGGKAL